MEALFDACAVSYLFQAGQKEFLRVAAAISRIHFVAEVANELEKERSWGDGFKKLKDELVTAGHCEVHELIVDTPEATLYKEMQRTRTQITNKDKGELASIALAAFHPHLVFVTEDWGAIKLAIQELPELPARVVRTAAWLRSVRQQGAMLDQDGLERWAQKRTGQLPRWWNDWLNNHDHAPLLP